jgi:hypothetical protein
MSENTPRSPPVASREYRMPDGTSVISTIYSPTQIGPDKWECTFTISGMHPHLELQARGADALQALIEAIGGLRKHLLGIQTIKWLDAPTGAVGIPRYVVGHDFAMETALGKVLDDAIETMGQGKSRTA